MNSTPPKGGSAIDKPCDHKYRELFKRGANGTYFEAVFYCQKCLKIEKVKF